MTRARWGALLLIGIASSLMLAGMPAQAQQEGRRAIVFQVPAGSFEGLMGVHEAAALARSGGAGLQVRQLGRRNLLFGQGLREEVVGAMVVTVGLSDLGQLIDRLVRGSGAGELLVVVAGLGEPSAEMRAENDEVLGIVVASGPPAALLPEQGPQGSLTSDSTRRDGVVTDLDVAPTVLEFLEVDHDLAGSPIEIIDGPPPFELHERYLAQRRMYVPVGTAGAIYLAIGGLGGIAVLALGSRAPNRVRRFFGWWGLSVPMLAVGMLAVGHLPELSYATAVPMIAIVTAFGTLAFSPLEGRDVTLVPVGIGLAALAFFALEAILGWSGMLTPLLGGSQLDGGRFFGLPNVAIGVLIGSGLWVAHRLRPSRGFALLCALGLFAGLPYLGTNLGGGVSLFAAAGLWLAVRERRRLGVWKGLGVVVGVTLAGTLLILAAHAISPLETHVTEFEEDVSGFGGVVERFVDRLRVGFDLIARNPFALVPVLGLPVAIAAVLWPPAPLRPGLERSPAWRDAILVTLLAGVVAYLANDSGPAAAGFAFGMGLGGLLGVSLLLGAGKMVNR